MCILNFNWTAMSGKHFKNRPEKIAAKSFVGEDDGQYTNPNKGGPLTTLFWAPFDKRTFHWGIAFLSYIAEFLGTFVFVFVVNLAKASITGSLTSVENFLAGTFLGLIGGLTYYLASGWNMDSPNPEYAELPKHLSWTVSFAYAAVFRTGIIPLVFYLLSQTAGSLMAGGLLNFLQKGTVPTADPATMGVNWFVEIVGVFFIIFPLLFKHMAGATLVEEDARQRNAQFYAAGGRAFATSIFFQFQGYSFDSMVYLGGLVGLCTTATGCPTETPFGGSVVFYLLVPLLAVFIAVAFYALVLLLVNTVMWTPKQRTRRRGLAEEEPDYKRYPTAAEQNTNPSLPIQGDAQKRRPTTASDLDKYK